MPRRPSISETGTLTIILKPKHDCHAVHTAGTTARSAAPMPYVALWRRQHLMHFSLITDGWRSYHSSLWYTQEGFQVQLTAQRKKASWRLLLILAQEEARVRTCVEEEWSGINPVFWCTCSHLALKDYFLSINCPLLTEIPWCPRNERMDGGTHMGLKPRMLVRWNTYACLTEPFAAMRVTRVNSKQQNTGAQLTCSGLHEEGRAHSQKGSNQPLWEPIYALWSLFRRMPSPLYSTLLHNTLHPGPSQKHAVNACRAADMGVLHRLARRAALAGWQARC